MNTTCEIHDTAATKGKSELASTRPMLRIAIVLVVFILCCYVAFHVGAFIAASRGAGRHAVERRLKNRNSTRSRPRCRLGGQWAFDELDWSLKSQLVDETAGSDAEFEQLGRFAAVAAGPATAGRRPGADRAHHCALQIPAGRKIGNLVYRDRSARPAVRVDHRGRERARRKRWHSPWPIPRAATPGSSTSFTPRPLAEASATSMPPSRTLLPLPADARRSGGRFADDGQRAARADLARCDRRRKLLADWKAAGWEVRPSGLANPCRLQLLCARGDDVVYAWSADPHDSLQNLMLVRTPTPADTSP